MVTQQSLQEALFCRCQSRFIGTKQPRGGRGIATDLSGVRNHIREGAQSHRQNYARIHVFEHMMVIS
jgi:hypothetical protein